MSENYKVKGNALTALILCALAGVVCWFTAQSFMSMWTPDVWYPAPGFERYGAPRLPEFRRG